MKQIVSLLFIFAYLCVGHSGVNASNWGSQRLNKEQVIQLVMQEAHAQNFPVELALAVAQTESDFRTDVVSHKGARGVMQIMPATARSEFGLHKAVLFDARVNIRTGIQFLSDLIARYGRKDIALSHYNGGSAVNTAYGYRIIPATRKYVTKVLRREKKWAKSAQVKAFNIARNNKWMLSPEFTTTKSLDYTHIAELNLDERKSLQQKLRALVQKNQLRSLGESRRVRHSYAIAAREQGDTSFYSW